MRRFTITLTIALVINFTNNLFPQSIQNLDNIKGFDKFQFNSPVTNYLKNGELELDTEGTDILHNVHEYNYIGKDLSRMRWIGYKVSSISLTFHNLQLVCITLRLPNDFHNGDYSKMEECAYRADTISYTLDQRYGKSKYVKIGNSDALIWRGHKYTCSFVHREEKGDYRNNIYGCFSVIILSNRNWEKFYEENNLNSFF